MLATKPRTKGRKSRFLRIFFSVIVCLVAALVVSSVLWGQDSAHHTYRAGRALFTIVFLAVPLIGIIIFIVPVLFWLDQAASRDFWLNSRRSIILVIGLTVGVLTGHFNDLLGAFFMFLLFYWIMTGRVAGREGWSIRNFGKTKLDEKIYLVVMVSLLAPVVVTLFAKSVETVANIGLAVEPGVPPFQVQYEHQMTNDVTRALHRFPNAQACLEQGTNAERREDLLRMDWDKILTTGDAEVCTFRLLHEWGGVTEATSWLEYQGLRVGEHYSSASPYEGRDGTLRVDGSWSIRNNGPRFPTSGLLRRIAKSAAYGMGVYATFSADGEELLYVDIGFSTL